MGNLIAMSEYMLKKKMINIHMIGIGGIGMSGIAELLINLGYRISGSDIASSPIIERLQEMGAKIYIGHNASNIGTADLVVVSSAIKPDNDEIKAAKEKRIPVIQRAEMLAELMRLKYGIAIAGSHGKTTTTSMISTVLADANLDPTIVIGGKLIAIGINAKLGKGDFIVVEADESDKSFLKLNPIFEVITNIDKEHMDRYHTIDEIEISFEEFMNKVPFYGAIIACIDDKIIEKLLSKIEKRVITYGTSAKADYTATDMTSKGFESEYTLIYKGRVIDTVRLKVPGIHNVKNSLATIAIARYLDIPFEKIIGSLANFQGVERRFHLKGKWDTIMLIDDYAHHPTEIKAVIETAKKSFNKKIITIFQPHRYSRTVSLYREFADILVQSDIVIITEIYPASEKPIEGVCSKLILDEMIKKNYDKCYYAERLTDIPHMLRKYLSLDSIVITVGAGNLPSIHKQIIEVIEDYVKNERA